MSDSHPKTQNKPQIMAMATTAGVGGIRVFDDNVSKLPHNHQFISKGN